MTESKNACWPKMATPEQQKIVDKIVNGIKIEDRDYFLKDLEVQGDHLVWKKATSKAKIPSLRENVHIHQFLWAVYNESENYYEVLTKLCDVDNCAFPLCFKPRKMSPIDRVNDVIVGKSKKFSVEDACDCVFLNGDISHAPKIKVDGKMVDAIKFMCDVLHPIEEGTEKTEAGHTCARTPNFGYCTKIEHVVRVTKQEKTRQDALHKSLREKATRVPNAEIIARNEAIKKDYLEGEDRQEVIAAKHNVTPAIVGHAVREKRNISKVDVDNDEADLTVEEDSKGNDVLEQEKEKKAQITRADIDDALKKINKFSDFTEDGSGCKLRDLKTINFQNYPMILIKKQRFTCIEIVYAAKHNLSLPLVGVYPITQCKDNCVFDDHVIDSGKEPEKKKPIPKLKCSEEEILEVYASRMTLSETERLEKYKDWTKNQLFRLDYGDYYSNITGATADKRKWELVPEEKRIAIESIYANRNDGKLMKQKVLQYPGFSNNQIFDIMKGNSYRYVTGATKPEQTIAKKRKTESASTNSSTQDIEIEYENVEKDDE